MSGSAWNFSPARPAWPGTTSVTPDSSDENTLTHAQMSEAPVSLQTSGSLLGYQTGHQNKQEQMQKPLSLNSLKMKKDGKKKTQTT